MSFRIIKFTAENFAKLRVVEIAPDGSVVRITGKNGAGKTSVLNAIEAALAGADALPSKPLRRGETKGSIRLELGDGDNVELIVTRRLTEKGGDLIVEAPSGARFPSPQRLLNEMLGAITFDPLAFTRMKPRDQYETLRHLVPLEVDIDALYGLNQKDFETRTEVNRDAARLRAQASGIAYPEGTPTVPPDLAALAEELRLAGEHNTARLQIIADREQKRRSITDTRRKADEMEAGMATEIAGIEAAREEAVADIDRQIAELEERKTSLGQRARFRIEEIREKTPPLVEQLRAAATETETKLDAELVPESIDGGAIAERLSAASTIKQHVDARQRRETLEAEAAALEERGDKLTDAMAARVEQMRTAIAAAAMPVQGLGFGEGEVLWDDLPLSQASHAEQIRVSAAIAMAGKPKLRVMLIRDGSLLDEDSMAVLAAMVKEQDFQLWLEQVETDGRVGILLEDGSVVAPPLETPVQAGLL